MPLVSDDIPVLRHHAALRRCHKVTADLLRRPQRIFIARLRPSRIPRRNGVRHSAYINVQRQMHSIPIDRVEVNGQGGLFLFGIWRRVEGKTIRRHNMTGNTSACRNHLSIGQVNRLRQLRRDCISGMDMVGINTPGEADGKGRPGRQRSVETCAIARCVEKAVTAVSIVSFTLNSRLRWQSERTMKATYA